EHRGKSSLTLLSLLSVRPLHLARRRQRRVFGIDFGVGLEAKTCPFDVEFHVVDQRRDKQGLQQLMIVGSHLDFTNAHRELEPFPALSSRYMSLFQLPVITVSAPDARIFAT